MADGVEAEAVQNIYDEIEIDDMDFEEGKFFYPCPCGDKFQITLVSTKADSYYNICNENGFYWNWNNTLLILT